MATGLRKKFDDILSRLDTICVLRKDRRSPADSKDRAYAQRRAVKELRWNVVGGDFTGALHALYKVLVITTTTSTTSCCQRSPDRVV